MSYVCEHCHDDIEEDDGVLIMRRPDREDIAWHADQVECAEAGAEEMTTIARTQEAKRKPDAPPKPNAEEPAGDSE